MEFSVEDRKEAKQFVEFYIDKIENHRNYFRYYLSENVILDWFGKTIKGEKAVVAFLKQTITSVNHILSEAVPVTTIGFKDSHNIKIPKDEKTVPFGLLSPPRTIQLRGEIKTPKKQPIPSTSYNNNNRRELRSKYPREQGQGDGFHNTTDILTSPLKKLKTSEVEEVESLETLESECDCTQSSQQLKHVISEGFVEFHKPSLKKYQAETKWRRPWNVKCRRNLMKEFEAEEPEN